MKTEAGVDTVRRAFQLARSGHCRSIDDIRRALKRDACESVDQHLASRTLRDQLTSVMVDVLTSR